MSFELLTQPGLPLTASQQWYKVLTDLGVSGLQIRSGGVRDQMGVTREGNGSTPQFRVVGILGSDNVLNLPGGKFKPSDTPGLAKWLDHLTDEGPAGVTEQRSAFGLVASQLQQVNNDLKRPVGFSTRDVLATKAINGIGRGLKLRIEIDEAAAGQLTGVKVANELKGLSSGTGIAAILRPAGLVLEPERPWRGELHYRIGKPRRSTRFGRSAGRRKRTPARRCRCCSTC